MIKGKEGGHEKRGDMKIVVATILFIGTLVGISALVSAVYKTDKAVLHASGVWHQHEGLTLRAIYVSIA